jgi:hypothetical protein
MGSGGKKGECSHQTPRMRRIRGSGEKFQSAQRETSSFPVFLIVRQKFGRQKKDLGIDEAKGKVNETRDKRW